MLAVRERYRNRGLGTQLKLEQRREALSRGIRHMEWTFDPLEIKNAFINIHRLGAIVRRYRVDFYGVSSSRLQGGLPTDRLVAEWQLDSPRVEAIVAGRPSGMQIIEERIQVPASIYAVEGLGTRQGTSPRRSVGESTKVSAGFFTRSGSHRLLPGCGRKRSLRTGSGYAIGNRLNDVRLDLQEDKNL